jgi:hypothetical protein
VNLENQILIIHSFGRLLLLLLSIHCCYQLYLGPKGYWFFSEELFILSKSSFVVVRSFILPNVQTTNTMAATVLDTMKPDKTNIITSNMVDILENINQMDLYQ